MKAAVFRGVGLPLDIVDCPEPKPGITDVVTLGALSAAFEKLRTPGHQCKVMIDPWRAEA